MAQSIPPNLNGPIPEQLRQDPLLWIMAEHYRVRDFCTEIGTLAKSPIFESGKTKRALGFLQTSYMFHILDKEDHLYPLISQRCDPETFINETLDRLSKAHRIAIGRAEKLIDLLQMSLAHQCALISYKETRETVKAFCDSQKENMALENAVIIPIARTCLTPSDLNNLKENFKAKRRSTASKA